MRSLHPERVKTYYTDPYSSFLKLEQKTDLGSSATQPAKQQKTYNRKKTNTTCQEIYGI